MLCNCYVIGSPYDATFSTNHLYLLVILVPYLPLPLNYCDVTIEHFRLSTAIRHVRELYNLLVDLSFLMTTS